MRVSEVRVTDISTVTLADVAASAARGVARVTGSFRQDEIQHRWARLAMDAGPRPLIALSLTMACGSGTYVRSLAHELGRRLTCGGVLGSLRRTRVGSWSVDDPNVIRFA